MCAFWNLQATDAVRTGKSCLGKAGKSCRGWRIASLETGGPSPRPPVFELLLNCIAQKPELSGSLVAIRPETGRLQGAFLLSNVKKEGQLAQEK